MILRIQAIHPLFSVVRSVMRLAWRFLGIMPILLARVALKELILLYLWKISQIQINQSV